LIVTGADRPQALARARRALREFEVAGMPTVLPFHRAVVDDPAFTSEPFAVHTRWIETEFAGGLPPYAGAGESGGAGRSWAGERGRIVVEVGGKRLEVVLPAGLAAGTGGPWRPGGPAVAERAGRPAEGRPRGRSSRGKGQGGAGPGADSDTLVSPMQ